MKKKINSQAIMNELQGQSAFFPGRTQEPAQPKEIPLPNPPRPSTRSDTVIPRHHDTVIPSNHNTMTPASGVEIIEAVRKAVRQLGREPATQRLTFEEKQALREIEFTYTTQSIQTSANEIIRIALNFLLADYRQQGENSILTKVLRKLNS